jgi:hypothetical protein
MPNIAVIHVAAAVPLPHAVHLLDLSHGTLGGRFGTTLEAFRRVARDVAKDGWAASAIHEPGRKTSYVFRCACPMASLRFSVLAVAITAGSVT